MWGVSEPRLANAKIRGDNLMGFGVDRFPIVREEKQAKAKGERLRRTLLNNEWLIIQLYHDKIIQYEFWNGIQVFIPTNGNVNHSQLSLLIPSNQLPLIPLPSMVFGFNTFVNKTTNYNWPCIIIFFPLFQVATFEVWWILSCPFFLIQSPSPHVWNY